ncbi:MAG: DUF4339 domain-containing protein, partial [Myxococcota bacterium]
MANQMMGGMMPGMQQPGGATVPPPPPAGPMFHVAVNGATQGPFAMQQLAGLIQQGQLNAQSLVWSAGMAAWTPAGQVPQLAQFFGPPPPPPPPAG